MIGTEFFICPSCMHVYKPTGGGGTYKSAIKNRPILVYEEGWTIKFRGPPPAKKKQIF